MVATAVRVPDVTVVVVVHNDADRLSPAVESVLRQTLANLEVLIVDDASTDPTPKVAAALSGADPRVRVVRHAENSGGDSRPRNIGIDHARAPYVMFLGSDNELERHACKNLLLAAERSGADVASGVCVQVLERSGNAHRPWLPSLYETREVLEGISAKPDLIIDTLCTNKIYRRQFLSDCSLRFAEGVHHEDLLFTAEAYCSAKRIALIPERVTFWKLRESPDSESIHNRTGEIRHFRDRITVHRMIDDYLQRQGLEHLQSVKDVNFLRVELRLSMVDLRVRTPSYQQQWLELAAEYLQRVPADTLDAAGGWPRLAAFLVQHRDLELAVAAAELWVRGRVASHPVVRDGRVFFADRYLDTAHGRAALDITSLHLPTAPLARLPLYAELTEVKAAGGRIHLAGRLLNPLGRLAADGASSIALSVRQRGRPVHRVPVKVTTTDERGISWTAGVDVERIPPRAQGSQLDVYLGISLDDTVNAVRLTIADPKVVEGFEHRDLAVRLTDDGDLAFSDGRPAPTPRRRKRGTRQLVRRIARPLSHRTVKRVLYRYVLARLPLRRDTVVYEAHLGRQFSDSPKYVYLALLEEGRAHRAVWSYSGEPDRFPSDSVKVKRDSWRYYYELARAAYWVDNQGLPNVVHKRRGQRYLQTWHGSPLKRMGYDEPQFVSPKAQQRLRAAVSRWDDFVVASSTAEAAFRQAFRLECNVLRTGYPRNDRLFDANDKDAILDIKKRMELPTDRRLLLYAPTWRDYRKLLGQQPRVALDLDMFNAQAGDEWFLLVRAHYLERFNLQRRHSPYAMDVSAHHDVTDLLLVADALLTDYSSMMFDFALTGRPMGFHLYDHDLYTAARGMYFELTDEAPGPVLLSTADITSWLADVDEVHRSHASAYAAFVRRHCDYERGTAARDVVRQVFGELPPGESGA